MALTYVKHAKFAMKADAVGQLGLGGNDGD